MSNLPILKTHCSVAYTTPSNTTLNLPINCANSNTTKWPWTYFRTTTTGLHPPVTVGGFQQSDPFFSVFVDGSGQAVVRGIFAYIATDPMTVNITMGSSYYLGEPPYGNTSTTKFIAKLYDPSGGEIETYKDSIETGYAQQTQVSGVLPATVCPKILWVGVSIQPAGTGDLLSPSANLEVSVT